MNTNKVKQISFNPEKAFKILAAIVLMLALAGFLAEYIKNFHDFEKYRVVKQFVRLLNLDEGTVQTWYSASLFLCSAFLLLIIGYVKKRINAPYTYHWIILSALFFLFSIDEICEIHERFSLFHISVGNGVYKYTWVLFAIPFVLTVFIAYIGFIRNLPKKIRNLVIIAGVLFINGSLVIEIFHGIYKTFYNGLNIFNPIIGTLEESLEMLGTVVFLYALMSYIDSHLKELRVYFDDSGTFTELDSLIRKNSQQSSHENEVEEFKRIAEK